MLRKTMLDECKGERLEEVLAVFSSAVLKKAAEEQQIYTKQHPAAAHVLALESRGYTGERTELNTLLLAHKVTLRIKLDNKKASKAQYKSFAELLDSKEQGLSRRREQATTKSRSREISEGDQSNVRRAVRNNWAGNEQWQEALVYGDVKTTQDGVLTAPFDSVWRRVRTNRLGELENKSGGLLRQLDSRVRAQQERLGKWQNFHKEMFGNVSSPSAKRSGRSGGKTGIDLGLGAHESLQLGRLSPRKLTRTEASRVDGEYDELLTSLETELRKVDKISAAPSLGSWRGRAQRSKFPKQRSSHGVADEAVSEFSELEEDMDKPPPALDTFPKKYSDVPEDADAISQQQQKSPRPRLPQPLSSMPAFRPKSHTSEISPVGIVKPQLPTGSMVPPRRSATRSIAPSPSLSPPRMSPPRRTQSPERLPPSPTQQQADHILASMSATSPSPLKQTRTRHTLSLAERTRLSLARGSSADLDDDEEEVAVVSPIRPSRRATSSRSPNKNNSTTPTTVSENTVTTNFDDPGTNRAAQEDDLVARTRKSMANFEATQQKARLERQRSQKRAARQQSGPISRQAYFPSLDEQGGGGAAGGNEPAVVLEELMAKEQAVDYDFVFKSRPKIKASPPSTPAHGHWEEEEEEEEL